MALTLRWKSVTTLPVDGSPLRPETFLGASVGAAERVVLRVGNRSLPLAELFRVDGSGGEERLILEGSLVHVRRLGAAMERGSLIIDGDAGPQLGSGMRGGEIEVSGSAGDWCGAEMAGGRIRIGGDSGHFLGAAYPGSRRGMSEGVILVEGVTGDDAGLLMRRGLIAIRGGSGAGLGRGMIAGTIVSLGGVARSPGAGMKRGTLVLSGPPPTTLDAILPSFQPAGTFRSPFLGVLRRRLSQWRFPGIDAVSWHAVARYNGDLVVGGQGELLVAVGTA
jgi:formylmethanofuran dehydrogenase subunit C